MYNRFNKTKTILAMVFTIMTVIVETYGFIELFSEEGFHMFIYYTVCSNFFLLVACFFWFIALFNQIRDGVLVHKFSFMMKYMATCMVAQTFLVVVFVLTPMTEFTMQELLFEESNLCFHFLGPVLAILSFGLIDCGPQVEVMDTFTALVPTLIYAAVSITMNILRIWEGPYPFLYVYEQSIAMSFLWFFVIIGLAYVIALLLRLFNRCFNREFVF